jgi:NAD(P)-dependent dehydrogenase (short-subunit alcohol dehydrogenase family)
MSTVLITGANRGLGLEFARQYAADGWAVIAACRNPGKAPELQAMAKANKKIHIEHLDVSDLKSIPILAKKLKSETIDVLINNAGILSGANPSISAVKNDKSQSFGSVDPDAWLHVMRVNVLAPLKMTEAFVTHVAQSEQRKIVMISSGWGSIERMDGDWYAYRPSKAMLNAVTKNLATDLKEHKICVVAFSPGWVQTDMGGKEADITPETSISSIRRTIAGLGLDHSGGFYNREGEIYPW